MSTGRVVSSSSWYVLDNQFNRLERSAHRWYAYHGFLNIYACLP
jgi:hypothetical protein